MNARASTAPMVAKIALRRVAESWVKAAFVRLLVRPVLWLVLGPEVRHCERLPLKGPAILVANHNSHMDTAAILSVLGLRALMAARPVGAGEYFFRTPVRAWMSRWLLGIIPVLRKPSTGETGAESRIFGLLQPITDALGEGDIVIFFPEGTRGRAGHIGPFKQGIAHLAKQCPGVSIIPLYLAGFSRVFPKGSHLPLPLLCSITVGEAVTGKAEQLADELRERVVALGGEDLASVGVSSAHMVAARRER